MDVTMDGFTFILLGDRGLSTFYLESDDFCILERAVKKAYPKHEDEWNEEYKIMFRTTLTASSLQCEGMKSGEFGVKEE
ncbi:hypothetical protein PENTCL1PPCAC_11993, partial [Pristionchus entomophagus]